MARYDYRCPQCNTVFEVCHGMKERPVVTCPDCGAVATRVFDASGIVLKGSGFYNTDMRGSKGATEGTSGKEIAKTTSGTKEIKKADDGGKKDLAKKSDAPAKPAAKNA